MLVLTTLRGRVELRYGSGKTSKERSGGLSVRVPKHLAGKVSRAFIPPWLRLEFARRESLSRTRRYEAGTLEALCGEALHTPCHSLQFKIAGKICRDRRGSATELPGRWAARTKCEQSCFCQSLRRRGDGDALLLVPSELLDLFGA